VVAVLAETLSAYVSRGEFYGFAVMFQQMSLFGDVFHTRHALSGVEWTLRVEVLFYLFMAALKFAGFIDGRCSRWLPIMLALSVLTLFVLPPHPGRWAWCFGYLNLYAPFLLLGVFFYLYEQGRVNAWTIASVSMGVLVGYWLLLPGWQAPTANTHFAAVALLMFVALWVLRRQISLPKTVLLLSELTYAVYLFHNWIYDYVLAAAARIVQNWWATNILAFFSLLAVCWLATRLIERPAVRFGHSFSQRFQPQAAQAVTASA
jgi:peptidoglycan/LPS O-acetylase OafA/YrhL